MTTSSAAQAQEESGERPRVMAVGKDNPRKKNFNRFGAHRVIKRSAENRRFLAGKNEFFFACSFTDFLCRLDFSQQCIAYAKTAGKTTKRIKIE